MSEGYKQVFEKEFEGRRTIGYVHSEGGYKVTAPAVEDVYPTATEVEDGLTVGTAYAEAGKDYGVESDSLEELRQDLIDYNFSEAAADEIVASFEGF